jgi:predicted dehydrogenase
VVQAGKRPQQVSRSLNEITEWYSKVASATFGPVLTACSVQRATADGTTNSRCIRIAGLLLQGDTYIGETVGLSMAKSLLGAERAEQIEERKLEPKNHFALEMDHLASCVLGNKRPRTPGQEGLQDMRVIAAIYRAAESGGTVKLPEITELDAFRGPALG